MIAPDLAGTGGEPRAILLPPHQTSPRAARGFVKDTLSHFGLESTTDDVVLVVVELVTNAVVHGDGPILLSIEARSATVLITVTDESLEGPLRRSFDGTSEGGRGMSIVTALSRRWGVRTTQPTGGKSVWAEVAVG